jgi:hypothetical protein
MKVAVVCFACVLTAAAVLASPSCTVTFSQGRR